MPDTMWIEVGILDVGGHPVVTLLSQEVFPRRHGIFWTGRDRSGRPVPGSLFWVTYVAGSDVRAHLLFREQ